MCGFGEFGTLADELVAAAAQRAVNGAGNRKQLASEIARKPGRDQRTAAACGFDHQYSEA